MNSKRLWVITTTIFSLSAFGPLSFGVWAQDQAVCRAKPATSITISEGPGATPGFNVRAAGWEWVRFFLARSFLTRRRSSCVNPIPLQIENSLGQDPCLIISMLSAACRGSCEHVVSNRSTSSFDPAYPSNLLGLASERHTGLCFSPTRWYLRDGYRMRLR